MATQTCLKQLQVAHDCHAFHLQLKELGIRVHKSSARLKAPLPPGTCKNATKFLRNMDYLNQQGHNASNPIHIDIPVKGRAHRSSVNIANEIRRLLSRSTTIFSMYDLLPTYVPPDLVIVFTDAHTD